MRLEVDCTWNQKKEKAKLVLVFDYAPEPLFSMPLDKIHLLKELAAQSMLEGPKVLPRMETIIKENPGSLYAVFIYFEVLNFLTLDKEAAALFKKLKKQWPQEVFTRCIQARTLLQQGKNADFFSYFKGIEVLKGVFVKRELFFFEEALFFHKLWAHYFHAERDEGMHQKHMQFIGLISNTAATLMPLQKSISE